ncbi:MAG TPA: MM0924 family protein [Pyrinomonadaceae bacterium]|nr:MM0924 family protein [Pyrinomonadaceae bacterium]
MRELLAKMVGKKVDLFCGGTSSLRGKVVKVDGDVAHLVDEDDQMFYVAVERVIVLSETRTGEQRAGFVLGFRGK